MSRTASVSCTQVKGVQSMRYAVLARFVTAALLFSGCGTPPETATSSSALSTTDAPDAGSDLGGSDLAKATHCGNGRVEPELGEDCDGGPGHNQPCCTNNCKFETSGKLCRSASGVCDAPDACTGVSADCPNTVKPKTELCRPSAGPCDIPEYCSGMGADCPGDQLANSATTCRSAAGPCDVAESCSGTSVSCPADVLMPATTVCRESAGVCDPREYCTGTDAACPSNKLNSWGTICRPKAGLCDIAESCTGSSADCPADQFSTDSFWCPQPNYCDPSDSCCNSGSVCGWSGEQCTGRGPHCVPTSPPSPKGSPCSITCGGRGLKCKMASGRCDGYNCSARCW